VRNAACARKSHRNLICICHRPSICHPRFPTRRDLSLFPPTSCSLARLPSRRLDTRLIPSVAVMRSHYQKPARPPVLPTSKPSLWPTSPCPALDRSTSRWDTPARSGPFSLSTFVRSLLSFPLCLFYLTVSYATCPLVHYRRYYSAPMSADAPISFILDSSHSVSLPTHPSP